MMGWRWLGNSAGRVTSLVAMLLVLAQSWPGLVLVARSVDQPAATCCPEVPGGACCCADDDAPAPHDSGTTCPLAEHGPDDFCLASSPAHCACNHGRSTTTNTPTSLILAGATPQVRERVARPGHREPRIDLRTACDLASRVSFSAASACLRTRVPLASVPARIVQARWTT